MTERRVVFHVWVCRYMIKTMSREEIRALDAIMGDYWRHMGANPRSLIVQYCGHFFVRLYRAPGEAPEDVHFLVMRNLLREPVPGVVVEERYDVKGSTVGRAASEKEKMRPPKVTSIPQADMHTAGRDVVWPRTVCRVAAVIE